MSSVRRRNQAGQAMLEGALVFTAVLCMIIFIMDIGRLLFYEQYFTERARYGARWAAVNTYNDVAIKNVVCYNQTTAPGGDSNAVGLFGLKPSNVAVAAMPTAANPKYIKVTIQNFNTVSMIPYIAGNFAIAPITVAMPAQSMGVTTTTTP